MTETGTPRAGTPALADTIEETRGVFASDAALQDAVARLGRLGFDRARLSLPKAHPGAAEGTQEAGADNPNTEDDARASRTVQVSTAAAAAGMAGAAMVAATGGALLAVAAAGAAAGALAGGGIFAAATASNDAEHADRAHAARQGTLVLTAMLQAPGDAARAEAAMREAGATDVRTVRRAGAGAAMGDFSDRDLSLLP